MALHLTLDDLSDDGLDLLLRLVLKTDERQIDSWNRMGGLLEQHKIELTYLGEPHGWNAALSVASDPDRTYLDQSGQDPKAAIARAVILKLKPDGIAMRVPMDAARSMLTTEWRNNDANNITFDSSIADGKASLDIQTNLLE